MDKKAKTFMVVGSGNTDIKLLRKTAAKCGCIIACDGGMGSCRKAGITPQVILGDFDSAESSDKQFFENMGVESFTFPARKDMTDSEIGMWLAEERGAEVIYMMGMTGSRLDHTITNIQLLLQPLKKGIRAILADTNNTIELTNSSLNIEGKKGELVSLIPLTERVSGITTTGLEYALNNADMHMGGSIGVSNVMLEDNACVTVKKGILMVIKSRD